MKSFLTKEKLWIDFPEDLRKSPPDSHYLQEQADRFLKIEGPAVTDKAKPGPGGDIHDYVSQAPYWWPDPAKNGGLPYIRLDGKLNPEIALSDRAGMEKLREGFSCLVLRSQWNDGEAYAAQAGRYLRRWFLDPETRMNPHLQYGQFIPGVCEGRGIGIIDTHMFCLLLDEVGHLPFNDCWTEEDLLKLKTWFDDYLGWLLESDHGSVEVREHNNHGTWYDAQIACFALFCDRPEIALDQIEKVSRSRFKSQFLPDGSQPHELERTLSMSYCTFNLIAFSLLAQAGKHLGLDLWKEEPALLAGVRWMLPFYGEEKPWTWIQEKPFNCSAAALLVNLAAQENDEEDLRKVGKFLTAHCWNRFSGWRIEVNQIPGPGARS